MPTKNALKNNNKTLKQRERNMYEIEETKINEPAKHPDLLKEFFA